MMSASVKQVATVGKVLNFLRQVAAPPAHQVVLDAGVLDMILRIYVIFPTLVVPTAADSERKAELFEACQAMLAMLSRASPAVFNHPVCTLWNDCHAIVQPPTYSVRESPITRRAAWRRAPRACASRRVIVIFQGSVWNSDFDTTGDIEAYADLVEFTRYIDSAHFN